MKLHRILPITIIIIILSSFTAFAGQWIEDIGGWMYIKDNAMPAKSEWVDIDGKTYYFDERGYMLHNTWIGEYYVGDDGARNGEYISTNTPYRQNTYGVVGSGSNNTYAYYQNYISPAQIMSQIQPQTPQVQEIVVRYEVVYR